MKYHISAPLRANIEITYRCNQSCEYCYNPHHDDTMILEEDFELVADELAKSGVFKISIAGGEPFLHPKLFQFYDYIAKNCFTPPIILTNGSVYNEKIISKLSKRNNEAPLRIQVSIDSITPIKGLQKNHIDKTINFINILHENKISPSIGIVATSLNIDKCSDIIYKFKKIAKAFHIMPPMAIEHNINFVKKNMPTKEQVIKLMETVDCLTINEGLQIECGFDLKEIMNFHNSGVHGCKGCAAAYTKCLIDPNLNVIACEISPNRILGNLKNSSLKEIWSSEAAKKIQNSDVILCANNN